MSSALFTFHMLYEQEENVIVKMIKSQVCFKELLVIMVKFQLLLGLFC